MQLIICSIITDPTKIREWIQYHLWLGTERIHLYYRSSLSITPIYQDRVSYYPVSEEVSNNTLYCHFINFIGKFYRWYLYLPMDEFIVIKHERADCRLICNFLYINCFCNALGINTITFDTNREIPDCDEVTKRYIYCNRKTDATIRTVVQSKFVSHMIDLQQIALNESYVYDTDFNVIEENCNENGPTNTICIHRYPSHTPRLDQHECTINIDAWDFYSEQL